MHVWYVFDGGHLGGSSSQDAEQAESIEILKTKFWRATESVNAGYPDECTVWLYDPNGPDVRDPYPDERWTIGNRGGVRRERL